MRLCQRELYKLVAWLGMASVTAQPMPSCQTPSGNATWLSWSPATRIFHVPRFIEPDVASNIIELALMQGLEPEPGHLPPYAILDAAKHPVVRELYHRACSELLGIPLQSVTTPLDVSPWGTEGHRLRVRRTHPSDIHGAFGAGSAGVFRRHTDAAGWPDENRVVVATIFMYLAEPPIRGGETYFPDLGVTLRATAVGDAFVWYNCYPDGTPAGPDAEHEGSIVHEGTKWTAIIFAAADPTYCAGLLPEPRARVGS